MFLRLAVSGIVLIGGCASDDGADRSYSAGDVIVFGLAAPAPAGDSPMALYLTMANNGGFADTLVSAQSGAADSVDFHRMEHGGASRMMPIPAIPLPAGDSVQLRPGGLHIMLVGLRGAPVPGDSLSVTLRFAGAGNLAIVAPVVAYSELERSLEQHR